MFNAFERMIAFRYLRARSGERFVSIIAIFSFIGIALGVATLIIVMAVMNGFQADLLDRILGLNGDVSVYNVHAPLRNYDDMVTKVRHVKGIKNAIPLVEGQALLSAGEYNAGVMVHGIEENDLQHIHGVGDSLTAGSLKPLSLTQDAAAIGVDLADKAGLVIGSDITLISPQGSMTAFGSVPRMHRYKVMAIFDAGVNDYNSQMVFLSLGAAQRYFKMSDAVSQIQVYTQPGYSSRKAIRTIGHLFKDPGTRVTDWTTANDALFGAVQVEQNVMFLILTLIIIVAAFNVISSLIMMVKDKTNDIAVLRTLGATKGAIMRIFLLCGASIGVTGTLLGSFIGIVFCLNIERIRLFLQSLTGTNLFNPEIYYLEHLPAKLVWSQVGEVVGMAILLSFLATLYPAWRAAKTNPVEALRYE